MAQYDQGHINHKSHGKYGNAMFELWLSTEYDRAMDKAKVYLMAGRYTHTSEAGLIIFLPLMYCTPPPTLLDTNTLKRMVGGNSPPPNLQHCKMFYNRLASGIIHLEAAVVL